MKFNILVIGDNRDNINWGCRSTSIALTQILSSIGNIKVLTRGIVSGSKPIGALTKIAPDSKYYQKALRKALQLKPVHLCYSLLGGRFDYIVNNPQDSIKLFRRAIKENDILLGEIYKKFEKADAIVINGEGSLIFRTPPRRDLNFMLFSAELACQLGKPVHFINAMASDCPKTPKNLEVERAVAGTLKKCQSVLVRDTVSKERLEKLGLTNIEYSPDALFSWVDRYGSFLSSDIPRRYPELLDSWPESDQFRSGWVNFPSEYVCFSGASRPPGVDISKWGIIFEKIVMKAQKETGLSTVLINPCSDGFLEEVAYKTDSIFIRPQTHILLGAYILANAKAYVSGRYHPSILASLGGTPCVFMTSNSHKTRSLQNVLGYEEVNEFDISDSDENNITNLLKDLDFKLNSDFLRTQIKNKSLKNSDMAVAKIISTIHAL